MIFNQFQRLSPDPAFSVEPPRHHLVLHPQGVRDRLLLVLPMPQLPMTDKALEKLKHQNAIALENFKWEKKKEELSFLEAGQHLRALNQQLWQVPGMAIAVTGGIWYGAISISYDLPKLLAFCFAATVDLITIIVLIRLRSIIQIQINLQNKFNDIQPEKTGQLPEKDGSLSRAGAAC
ncbi:TPA: hypothetical protein NH789_002221 [Pseudomonas aeruginosa]|nr:hypothetical protein [Pseudomonas aeruginosa]